MENLVRDIDRVYKGLQHLQLESTKTNIAIVWDTMTVLERVYQHLTEEESHANTNDSGN